MFGQNKPAWGDAVGHPIFAGYQPSAGATGATGAPTGFTGCTGPVGSLGGSYGVSTVNVGRIPGLPYIDELPRNVSEVTKCIRPHRRVYPHELIGNESLLSVLRNRVLVRTVEYYARNETETLIPRYVEWLDDHNSGLYMIDATPNQFELVVSFELEPDMIQFAIALR